MPFYKIVGSGRKFPKPLEHHVESTSEALTRLDALRDLCGKSVAYDESGNVISRSALLAIRVKEIDNNRKQLKEQRLERLTPNATGPLLLPKGISPSPIDSTKGRERVEAISCSIDSASSPGFIP